VGGQSYCRLAQNIPLLQWQGKQDSPGRAQERVSTGCHFEDQWPKTIRRYSRSYCLLHAKIWGMFKGIEVNLLTCYHSTEALGGFPQLPVWDVENDKLWINRHIISNFFAINSELLVRAYPVFCYFLVEQGRSSEVIIKYDHEFTCQIV